MKRFSSLFIIAAAVCWGIIGIATRSLSDLGFSSFQICAVRCILSATVLTVYLAVASPSSLRIELRDLWMFFGTGVCSIVFFNVCYFHSMQTMTLSVATILLYTAPIFVMLMSAVFFGEKITGLKLLCLLLAMGGCVLVTGVLSGQSSVTPLGILTGLGSGFGYALYSIFGRAALKKYGSLTVTTYTFLVAGICVLPFCGISHIVRTAAQPGAVGYILYLVLISTVTPYLLYTVGLRFTEAGKASVIASVEPVVSAVAGILVYHETLSLMAAVGAILVLGSIILLNLPPKRQSAHPE